MPARRPRRWAGMVSFQIVMRKRPLSMSAAPASRQADHARPAGSARSRAPRSRRPTSAAAITTAAPRRATRLVHPLNSVITRLPIGIAEYSQPAAVAPPQRCGHRGEQRHRHREGHGDDVDDVGADQLGPAARVIQPFDDAAQAGLGRLGRRAASTPSPRARPATPRTSRRRSGRSRDVPNAAMHEAAQRGAGDRAQAFRAARSAPPSPAARRGRPGAATSPPAWGDESR